MEKVKRIIEALVMISGSGISREQLQLALEEFHAEEIEAALEDLREEYSRPERSFLITEIAGRFRLAAKPEYMPWINNLYRKEADRLTGPSLETLAIIAYKQPATRAEIEAIRGVNSGGVIKTLIEKELIRIKGRKDVIGRPLMYATTGKFLEIFGLGSLEDLPILKDFSEDDLDYGKEGQGVSAMERTELSENTGDEAGQNAGDN